jgi:hypothetical protein
VQWGFYKEQIEHWFDYYPREQFLFLRFEDLASDGEAQTQKVFDFLGLPPAAIDAGKVFNAGPSYPVEENDITRRLAEIYREKNAGLDQLIGSQFVWGSDAPASNVTETGKRGDATALVRSR